MGKSFIQLNRGLDTVEVLKDPKAFALLTQIALRARRTSSGPNFHGLKVNEALIGDYESIGLTEQEYRSAKKRLSKYGLATFKGTNKGTIATLCNTSIYDINTDESNDPDRRQATDKQRASNDPATTKKNEKKLNKDNNGERDTAREPFDLKKTLNELGIPEFAKELFGEPEFREAYTDYWLNRIDTFNEQPKEYSVKETYRRLIALKKDGHSPVEVLRQSTRGSNKELFPLRDKKFGNGSDEEGPELPYHKHIPNKPTRVDRDIARFNEILEDD